MPEQFFQGQPTVPLALIGCSNHQAPEEDTGAVNAVVVIRASVRHDEADGGFIGIDGTHPGAFGKMGFGNRPDIIRHHLMLNWREGFAQLANLVHCLCRDMHEVNIGGWG